MESVLRYKGYQKNVYLDCCERLHQRCQAVAKPGKRNAAFAEVVLQLLSLPAV